MGLEREARREPFNAAVTFGETAERAVAPRAMDVAVGIACDVEARRGGGILAAEVAMICTRETNGRESVRVPV